MKDSLLQARAIYMSGASLCGLSDLLESSFKGIARWGEKKLLEINVGKGYNKFAVQKSFVNNWQINSRPAHSSQEQFANREGSCAV